MIGNPRRWPLRRLMYVVVGLQVLVLAFIVASQELNMGLDRGPGVDLEIVQARAHKDPFRGANISGQSALELDGGTAVAVPPRLRPGDKVLVTFTPGATGRPRIAAVERAGALDAPFSDKRFTITGTVLDTGHDRPYSARHGRLRARVGEPATSIELALPESIPIDDAALGRITGPGLVRARLHQGFLGRRYFSDVRIVGRGWTSDMTFVYDEARHRLVVFSPLELASLYPSAGKPRTLVCFFDALGHPVRSLEVQGRIIESVIRPGDGVVLALVSDEPWGNAEVALARIQEDGSLVQRSVLIPWNRIVGFDETSGGVWRLTGLPTATTTSEHFVERMTLDGPQAPRLGPFTSAPRNVVMRGGHAFVVETEQHRVTRLDVTTGRPIVVYRELNGPTSVAVEGSALYVIEANASQITKLAEDGRVLWRVPRFSGLTWIVPEPGTEGGWIGAATFEGKTGGILRFGPEGSISRGAAAELSRRESWRPHRFARDAFVSVSDGRLFVRETSSIAIRTTDGALRKRVDGFPLETQEQLRK